MGKRRNAEITPKMIDAGVSELLAFHRDFEREEDAVVRIYAAMAKAAPSARRELSNSRGSTRLDPHSRSRT